MKAKFIDFTDATVLNGMAYKLGYIILWKTCLVRKASGGVTLADVSFYGSSLFNYELLSMVVSCHAIVSRLSS